MYVRNGEKLEERVAWGVTGAENVMQYRRAFSSMNMV
jgi:flavoprotein